MTQITTGNNVPDSDDERRSGLFDKFLQTWDRDPGLAGEEIAERKLESFKVIFRRPELDHDYGRSAS